MTSDFPRTINELFNTVIAPREKHDLLRYKRDGSWRSMSATEVVNDVKALAAGLHSLGVSVGDRVGLLSENRPEWIIADLAILGCGAADVPVYATSTAHQIEYLIKDSGPEIIFVSTKQQKDKVEGAFGHGLSLKLIVSFDEGAEDDRHLNYSSLIKKGRDILAQDSTLFERLSAAVDADSLGTLIYTSGTTGEPKGVILTHRSLIANVRNTIKLFGVHPDDVVISFLPLSHVFERATTYNYLYFGVTLCFAESIDLLPKNLQEIHPTFMTSVPRFFEKVYGKISQKMAAAPFPQKHIAYWGMHVGRLYAQTVNSGKPAGLWLRLQYAIAYRIVFKKWREIFGGRLRCAVSGGAALPVDIGYVFLAAGIEILQGYGLTETTAGISTNTIHENRIGTVGKVIPGVELKLASDGEILVKGDNITAGYYNRPDADAEAFDAEGWFRTGDIGQLDNDGFLTITDRKKDLIKTSGGKYIAPQPIENLIKGSRFISQVVVVGNGRKYASALIVPNKESLRSYAKLKGLASSNEAELISNDRIVDLIEREVAKFTSELARYETVKKIALLDHELTIEGGEMTRTLKVKRRFVEEKYKEIIDRLYDETANSQRAKAADLQEA